MKVGQIRVTFLSCCLMLVASSISAQEGPPPPAREVLDKMIAAYASCKTYSDTGKVRRVFYPDSPTVTTRFSTAFVRPSQFRFEFFEEEFGGSQNFVVWQDGATVKSWWSLRPKVELYEQLSLAVASAAGISNGTAVNVPSMLMNLGDSQRIQRLSRLSMLEDKVDGRPAYKIAGVDWRGNPMTIWIDKKDFLLLKIWQKVRSVETEETTTYKPQINAPVPPKQLAFGH